MNELNSIHSGGIGMLGPDWAVAAVSLGSLMVPSKVCMPYMLSSYSVTHYPASHAISHEAAHDKLSPEWKVT